MTAQHRIFGSSPFIKLGFDCLVKEKERKESFDGVYERGAIGGEARNTGEVDCLVKEKERKESFDGVYERGAIGGEARNTGEVCYSSWGYGHCFNRLSSTRPSQERRIEVDALLLPGERGDLTSNARGASATTGSAYQSRYVKIDFPRFGGDDPRGWVYQCEQYFMVNNTEEEHKVQFASIHLNERQYNGSVKMYQECFEELASRMRGLSEDFYVSCFTSGLKDEIHMGVQMFKPRNITQAIGLAHLQEDGTKATTKRTRSTPFKQPIPPPTNRSILGNNIPPINNVESHLDEDNNAPDDPSTEDLEIFVHALVGSASHHTMRIRGYIKRRSVVILIDSGSAHNFLDPSVAKRTGCEIHSIEPIYVTIAKSERIQSMAVCRNFQWVMQGSTFETEMRLLSLGGCDMVLGVQCLSTLGPIMWDFEKLRMEFTSYGRQHVLRGGKGGVVKLINHQ
ncbi:hypothetical protein HHK36_002410 [Tetracentron sinense]|uniref:Retrotransposon gag domain-containing protein n=1 Tax=Tetracentron sinense TaxID=13715 RepID=A0A835DRI8_TETSI|nr:hypothetical protein HHK36_002410 [Tetracentron sinense]